MVAAMKDRIVGYQMAFSIQSSQMAKKPVRWPKASLTQTKTPPLLGQPVASSAATRDTGMKKMTAAKRR